ncbi:beta-lactamase family protein [Actinoplanes sp. KI2]|uniref:serine hydrolase domain-containing protein n=1 Tax=Actinoplanes sp. KI2 TaxID=2983315 RepID=UPI0021D5C397|nr:serine hydrolase domain-containing protein [Actinoplanes sp. KI2]MCU7724902.1 beta-lactamase family protein [Actinoplanes sp. KI2]
MNIGRRTLLGTGLAATAAALTGCGRTAPAGDAPVWAEPVATEQPLTTPGAVGRAIQPAPSPRAVTSAATPAGPPYAAKVKATLTKYLVPTADNPKHPGYAGAVALVMQDGKTRFSTAAGHALRYGAGPVDLPAAKRVAMRTDSIFDLASLTKVCTAILTLQLVDRGKVELNAPVQRYLPEFTGAGKDKITIAMLLAHTSALPVGAKVTGFSTNTQRWQSVMTTPLVKGGVPGTTFRYSSVGLMVLGRLVEKLTGTSLDKAVRDNITTPLGLEDTGFLPLKWVADKSRLVATDARTSRGLLRGTVHDDVANILGGVAGHAGLFGTAQDVAVIGQMLLAGGTHHGRRILSADTVAKMLTNVNKGKPAIDADRPHRTADHGLGVEINQPWFMGKLASPTSFGHTGFTGTSLLVVPSRRQVIVLLTNRAHPNWSWSNPDTHRVAVHNAVAAG